jgi:hypothetical protein
MYKVVTLWPHCSSQLSQQLPSPSNRTTSLSTMTAQLLKTKTTLLNLMKSLPEAHITEEADFVVWGRRFVDAAVSHV